MLRLDASSRDVVVSRLHSNNLEATWKFVTDFVRIMFGASLKRRVRTSRAVESFANTDFEALNTWNV